MSATSERGAFSVATNGVSSHLKSRIRASYKQSFGCYDRQLSALWGMITDKNVLIHNALLDDQNDLGALDDPGDNNLLYGFDNLFQSLTRKLLDDPDYQAGHLQVFLRELARLGEALGVLRVWNPRRRERLP